MKIETYLHTSLASIGFAILDAEWAATLRPDLWRPGNGGFEAAHDLAAAKNMIRGLNLPRYVLRLEGTERDLPLLARSPRDLERRIEWVTGRKVRDLFAESDLAGVILATPDVPPRAVRTTDDKHQGVVTKEPGKTCSACANLTAGHRCSKAADSGIEHPAANVSRRCVAFEPHFDAMDARSGRQLWPELLA
ncbi:MAG: hypothetical protein N2Z61_00375 [Tepidimonas fonticaldi]|nr:hypothetical protein [Tepidimonas fonticaldi]